MKGNTEHTLQTVNGGTHERKVAKGDVKNALKNVRPGDEEVSGGQ